MEKVEKNNLVLNGKTYNQAWMTRFQFFQEYGAPNTKTHKQAYKALPYGTKLRIGVNFLALFFPIIYLLIKGMWKAVITLFGLTCLAVIISMFLPRNIDYTLGFMVMLVAGLTTNYTYYRKEVLGEHDFNIFKGIRIK